MKLKPDSGGALTLIVSALIWCLLAVLYFFFRLIDVIPALDEQSTFLEAQALLFGIAFLLALIRFR